MIAQVVPHARTLRTLTVFDYEIPPGMAVHVGDCVMVPFRNKILLGVVMNITEHSSAKSVRPIHSATSLDAWRSYARRSWLTWFSQWYAISLPHAFKTLQHSLPKRLAPQTMDAHASIQLSLATQNSYIPHITQAQRYRTIIEWYIHIAKTLEHHTLLICPEHTDVQTLAHALSPYTTIQTVSEHATAKQLSDIEQLLNPSARPLIVIGTKKVVSMNLLAFGTIIIDQEESTTHKQRELNPRYHVRRILLNAQEQARVFQEFFPRIVLTSIAPSIDAYHAFSQHMMTREVLPEADHKESAVRVISMHEEKQKGNYSWFSEEVIERAHVSHKTLFFLNRTGEYSYQLCSNCSTILVLSARSCTTCGNVDIRTVRKGIAQLEKECALLFPNKKIERIDRTTDEKKIAEKIMSAEIIFATEKIFHVTSLDIFDYCAILSIDHLLSYPHYRSHERAYQLLRRFFSTAQACDLQTHSPNHLVIQCATQNTYDTFADQELAMRKMVSAPPYGYRARIINTVTRESRVISQQPQHPLKPEEMLDPEY